MNEPAVLSTHIVPSDPRINGGGPRWTGPVLPLTGMRRTPLATHPSPTVSAAVPLEALLRHSSHVGLCSIWLCHQPVGSHGPAHGGCGMNSCPTGPGHTVGPQVGVEGMTQHSKQHTCPRGMAPSGRSGAWVT